MTVMRQRGDDAADALSALRPGVFLLRRAWRSGSSTIQSAGIAKLRFCASPVTEPRVVNPTSAPLSSNRPPPLEPPEIDADVCTSTTWPLLFLRSDDTRPALIVSSRPRGVPIA